MKRIVVLGTAFCALFTALYFVTPVFGFRTATVNSYNTGTFYPQTVTASSASPAPFVSCEQTSGTTAPTAQINLTKNSSGTKSYFSCTNNWGSSVTFTITVANANGTTISLSGVTATISPGQTKCVPGTITIGNTNGGDVLYTASATATDLSATLQFAGNFKTPGGDSAQCSFP